MTDQPLTWLEKIESVVDYMMDGLVARLAFGLADAVIALVIALLLFVPVRVLYPVANYLQIWAVAFIVSTLFRR